MTSSRAECPALNFKAAERDALARYLAGCESYLEYGAGASTALAVGAGVRRIRSVESSTDFVDRLLATEPAIQRAVASSRLTFSVVDIGPTGGWGTPLDDSRRHVWPNYPLGPYASGAEYNLILIDGRFRVACALAALLSTDSTCLLHDFRSRPEYHVLLPFLTVVEQVHSLLVFRRRPGADRRRMRELLVRYQYLPRDIPARSPLAGIRRLFVLR